MSDPIDLAALRAARDAAKQARESVAQDPPSYVPASLLKNIIGALDAEHAYAKSLEAQIAVLARHVAPDKAAFEDILSRLRQLEAKAGQWPAPIVRRA